MSLRKIEDGDHVQCGPFEWLRGKVFTVDGRMPFQKVLLDPGHSHFRDDVMLGSDAELVRDVETEKAQRALESLNWSLESITRQKAALAKQERKLLEHRQEAEIALVAARDLPIKAQW